jgi:hypothetical protein
MSGEQVVARLIESLERDGVAYMLVGALSSNLYGVPRATNDADLVVRFDSFNLVKRHRRCGESARRIGRHARLDLREAMDGGAWHERPPRSALP